MSRPKPKLVVVETDNVIPPEVLERLRAERALKAARAGSISQEKTAS
jgi:hypothetical protein